MKKHSFMIGLAASLLLATGCGKEEEDKKDPFQLLPSITPAVEKAKADGFSLTGLDNLTTKPMALTATPAEAAEALRDFFTDNVNSIGGYTKKGWIEAYLYDLDKRIEETKVDTEPSCMAAAPVAVAFDTGFSGHKMTLNLNCIRTFESATDQSGSGSGLAYGKDDNKYYMYVMLSQKSQKNDKFGYVATLDRTTEAVELMFLERSVTWNRTKFFRLRTTPSPKKFEFSAAATSDGAGPASTNTAHVFAPGVRFVSDASFLRAEGTVAKQTMSAGETDGTTADFDATECFNAADLSAATTACTSTAPAFATDMTLVASTAVPAAADTVNGALKTMQALEKLGIAIDLGPPAAPED